jgi:hypothetical protein
VSIALADDFKTINGKEYKNATISRVEGDGIVLRTKTGISKVYFVELPQDVQEKFHYGPATPSAAQREREAIKLEAIQAVTPSDVFGWPGSTEHLTQSSERTGIENNWFAITGRVVCDLSHVW